MIEQKPTTYRFEVIQEVDIEAQSEEEAEAKLTEMFKNFFYTYLGEVEEDGNVEGE